MEVSEVHNRVVELINEKHITKYRLAIEMGVMPSVFYNMFNRKTMPTVDTIEKICDALDISLSDFFAFSSEPGSTGYLSEDERILIEMYRPLSNSSKDRIKAYVEGIRDVEKG